MGEMVERVAKAICSAIGDDWDRSVMFIIDAKDTPETAQEVYRDQARAAIEAMRLPTPEMTAVMKDYAGRVDQVSATWIGMIDEALKE